MRKPLLICGLLLISSPVARAQDGTHVYRFDNFDTRDGVRILEPEAPAPRKVRSRLRLTARAGARKGKEVAQAFGESAAPGVPSPVKTSAEITRANALPALPGGDSLAGFSTGDRKIDTLIVESGRRHGVDPVLLYAVMHRESSFRRTAVSHKGASGLMQLMPATARRFGVRSIFDPAENIEGGTRYMRFLLDTFDGDVRLALAGYNAGEGAVMKYGWRVPPYRETQEYVRRITERYAIMRDPQTARRARPVNRPQLARLRAAEPGPEPLYERDVFAVRTPDGRLMLVSQ